MKLYEVTLEATIYVVAKDDEDEYNLKRNTWREIRKEIDLDDFDFDFTEKSGDNIRCYADWNDEIPFGEVFDKSNPDLTVGEILERIKEEGRKAVMEADMDDLQPKLL